MLRLAGKKMKEKKMNSIFSRIDSHHFGPNNRKHIQQTHHPSNHSVHYSEIWNSAKMKCCFCIKFKNQSKTFLSFLNFWKRGKENIAKFKINAYLGTHQKEKTQVVHHQESIVPSFSSRFSATKQ